MKILLMEAQFNNPLKADVILVSSSSVHQEISSVKSEIEEIKEEINNKIIGDLEFKKTTDEKIATLEEKVKGLEVKYEQLSWLSLAKSQGIWKSQTCKHAKGGICSAWNISEPEIFGIPQDAIQVTESGRKVIVSVFPYLCISCPLYDVP
ncbi:hypothetical protein HS7_05810 [Sulfolobales archaeon HS-7]|nr:hypothetical protein HS7_05810 [Sulfolobales archaeon HS-7]